MKLISAIVLLASSCSAFVPISQKTSFVVSPNANIRPEISQLYSENDISEMTEDEEIEMLVQKELKKNKRISNLRNSNGVDYAPWMNISEDDEKEIRQLMKEKNAARKAREEQEKSVTGSLYLDSQAQELSGTGLKNTIVDGSVELEWATKSEKGTKGFIVKRRAAKTNEFYTIGSYEDWGPLSSQGEDGGIYRYFDETVSPGGWVYRVSEVDTAGNENDVCQCLVEIQTKEEQTAGLIAGVGIGVLAIGAVAAGILLDPMNGY